MQESQLLVCLEEAQNRGFLGVGDVVQHAQHAQRFVKAIDTPPDRALDLGSGGGLPGLVTALAFSDTAWVFLDVGERRCIWLEEAVQRLGLENVEVRQGRAEDLARLPELRQSFDLVVARSFGKPSVVAECATGFMGRGARLLVSEPPEELNRWPVEGLHMLGLAKMVNNEPYMAELVQHQLCSDKWPRKNGQPAKRPLFHV